MLFLTIVAIFLAVALALTLAGSGEIFYNHLFAYVSTIRTTVVAFLLLGFIFEWINKSLEHMVDLKYHGHYDSFIQKLECFKQPYRLSVWTVSGHLNTFVNAYRSHSSLEYRREIIQASDDAPLVIDWFGEHNATGPTVFILPGVSGHSQAGYITPLVLQLSKKGYCVAVHSHPGMNGAPLTKGRFTRCFDTVDTAQLVAHVKRSRPNSPLIAIGYSLGAAMLVKYIGSHKHDKSEGMGEMPISAAMVVSCPWDFTKIIKHIQTDPMAKLYDRYFCSIYRAVIEALGCGGGFSKEMVDRVGTCYSLAELDELITRKIWGFENISDYYASVGCVKELANVSIPLLVLHANDDPLVPTRVVPKDVITANKHVVYAETQKGGHVAWLSGYFPTKGLSWLDLTSIECVEGFITYLHPETGPKLQRNID